MEAVRGRGIPRRYYGTLRTLGRLRGQAGAATGEDRHIRRPHRAWWRGARTRREGSEQSSALRERPPVECMRAGLDACKACPPRATSRGMHAGRARCMQSRAGCMQGWEGRAGCKQGRVRQGQDACRRGCIGGAGERGRAVRPSAAGAAATSRYRSPGPQSQTQSDAIRCNQTQSDAIRRNQTAHLDRRQQD